MILKVPFCKMDLISGADTLEGIKLLYNYKNLREYDTIILAKDIVLSYEPYDWSDDWTWDKHYTAVKKYIDSVIKKYNIPLKTEYYSKLKIVKL